MSFFGKLFIGFLAVVVILGIVGFIMSIRAKKRGEAEDASKDVLENVADLNDRFNRARYMDEDKPSE